MRFAYRAALLAPDAEERISWGAAWSAVASTTSTDRLLVHPSDIWAGQRSPATLRLVQPESAAMVLIVLSASTTPRAVSSGVAAANGAVEHPSTSQSREFSLTAMGGIVSERSSKFLARAASVDAMAVDNGVGPSDHV